MKTYLLHCGAALVLSCLWIAAATLLGVSEWIEGWWAGAIVRGLTIGRIDE